MKQQLPLVPRLPRWARRAWLRLVAWLGGWFVIGCGLIGLAYQLPVRHNADLGTYDAGYVQGAGTISSTAPTIAGSGATQAATVRSLGPDTALLFPLLGWPSRFTLTLRSAGDSTATASSATVDLLLNGTRPVGSITSTDAWQTHSFNLPATWTKPDDLFVLLRVTPAPSQAAPEVVVDQASLATAGLVWPAPGQMLQGGLALMLAAAALRNPRRTWWAAILGSLVWLMLYRMPLLGYPLRHLLRWSNVLLAGALVIQHAPTVRTALRGWRSHAVLAGLIIIWIALVWPSAQQHQVLAIPGVEKDFRVFATRSEAWSCPADAVRAAAPCVWRADGFYQLGYPLALWLARPLVADNPFLAARWLNLVSAMVLLIATYLIGLRLGGRLGGLLASLIVAWSGFTVQATLLLGTDMPFAATWTGALAALVWLRPHRRRNLVVSGGLLGLAFAVRHPGIVLLPLAWMYLWLLADRPSQRSTIRPLVQPLGWLTLGWLVVILPQLIINTLDTGQPLYSQQAKNIWLAVFGNTDWGRWDEASNSIGLLDVIRLDPVRFLRNWGRNLMVFFGTGGGDLSEFGQANMLRLLGFPANLLAVFGLGRWLWRGTVAERLLAAAALLYVLAISISFVLPRFSLPLVGIWAVAASSQLLALTSRWRDRPATRTRCEAAAVLAMALLLGGQPRSGSRAVLALQAPAEVALVGAIVQHVPPSATLAAKLAPDEFIAKYSAIAHRFTAEATSYAVWSKRSNAPRPNGKLLATSEPYELWETASGK